MENPPLKTFICYAHEDHEVVSALRKHLAVFEKRGLLEIWFDGKILAGENWDKSIKTKLEQAELVLMFISVDFINSDYIEKTELQAALQRHRDGKATLIPIIVRSCHWSEYFEMGKFQALPKNARPILSQHFPFRDDAFHEVAEGVRLTAQDSIAKRIAQRMVEDEQAEVEAQRKKAESEKAEKQRHSRDEAAWKKVLMAVASAANEDKIEIYQTYLDGYLNHLEEAQTAIDELEADLELAQKLKERRENAEKKWAEDQLRNARDEMRNKIEVKNQETKRQHQEIERQNREAEARAKNLPEMVLVKGGTFQMGEKGVAEPIHAVTVGDFYLGKYTVTFDEYDRFCNETKRKKTSDAGWGRGKRPVINVSWDDAQAYCAWLSIMTGEKFRLPTEAEWEYAAREGGKNIRFGNGKDIANPTEMNFNSSKEYKQDYSVVGEYRGKTVSVGSLNCPNALGLDDMSGNVAEWCGDWYGDYPSTTQNNPTGPASGSDRVLRGGSWGNDPQNCRAAVRLNISPGFSFFFFGFRLARAVSF